MSDLEKKILDIIHKPQLSALATITENNTPWVRYVVTVGGGNMELRCATMLNSRKVEQIENNPFVHLTCGVNSLQEMSPYLQVEGKARIITDEEEKESFWNDMLEPIFKGPADPNYAIIAISPLKIEYCTPGSYQPEVWER